MRRGLKAEAERIALDVRAEHGLAPDDRLDSRDLAAHLGIPVLWVRGRTSPVNSARPLGIPILRVRDLEAEGAGLESIKQTVRPDSGFSALTVCAGSARLIVYNQRQPPGRRANSLAHEVAHVILEHPPAPVLDAERHRR